MPRTLIHGACPHDCPDTCGIITEVEDGRAVDFYADPTHPITQGWLCAKVRPYLDRVYHPDRLTHPLRRVGPKGSGQWQRISWDTALAEIAERWQGIIRRYGAEAILPYSYSGTLGAVQMTVCNGRFWNRLGASQLDRAICGEAAAHAVNVTLGLRHAPPYEQVLDSKLVVIWGHNPVSTAPHFMPWLAQARRNGTRLIVIDPIRTRTAQQADWHLAPRPGTDGALALGLAHILVRDRLHNDAWLTAHTLGWPELRTRLADYPPEYVAQVTGVTVEDLNRLAHEYATTTPALLKFADGVQRNRNGGQNVRAMLMLPALTGQIGVRGGGVAYSTSGTLQWASSAVNRWAECPPPQRVINMNRLGAALTGEVTDPPIMALYVYGANPVAVSPNAGLIVQGLQRDDLFTVVHELFLTDTADYADLVLPATSQLEHVDLHKAYGHTWLQYNAAAIPPLGESRSNWQVLRDLARVLGFTEPWLQQTEDEVIEDLLRETAAINPALRGITLAQLQRGQPVPLNLPNEVPFADLRFPTPSGKVELYSQQLADEGHDPLPVWLAEREHDAAPIPAGFDQALALSLLSPAAHHFVTSSMANQADLDAKEGEPFVELHPGDATRRGIADGDRVRVRNGRGWVELTARVNGSVQPGVALSPKGRWAKRHGGRNINWTVSDDLGDFAGQSTFHTNRVWVERV